MDDVVSKIIDIVLEARVKSFFMRDSFNFSKPWAPIVLVIAAFVAGCDSTLVVEDYSQTCQADTDCVSVLIGDICDCSCEVGFISKSDFPKYTADRDEAHDSCIGTKLCDACFDLTTPSCNQGKCMGAQP